MIGIAFRLIQIPSLTWTDWLAQAFGGGTRQLLIGQCQAMTWRMALILVLAGAGAAVAELDQARAEPNLEKRSKLALDNAEKALKDAREAYRAGDAIASTAKINEIRESVDLAYQSLMATGKNPRNSPKYFKQAELEIRELSRKLDAFQHSMDLDERGILDKVMARVQQVHDDLLAGLMEGRNKR
jgi:hypothetical protein